MDLNGQKVYLTYELLTFSNFGTWLRRFDGIFPEFSKCGGKIETISTIEVKPVNFGVKPANFYHRFWRRFEAAAA